MEKTGDYELCFNNYFSVIKEKKVVTIRDAKSEEHEERVPAIFPPAVLIFGLPTQKYAKIC